MLTTKAPICTICNVKLQNMDLLRVHMTNRHQETDHDRILRLSLTVKSQQKSEPNKEINKELNKLFCCSDSDCGLIFQSYEEQKSHNGKNHQLNKLSRENEEISDDSESEEELLEYDDLTYFDVEYTPKESKN